MKTPMTLLLAAACAAFSLLMALPAHAAGWVAQAPVVVTGSYIHNVSDAQTCDGNAIGGTNLFSCQSSATGSAPDGGLYSCVSNWGCQWTQAYVWTGPGAAQYPYKINVQEADNGSVQSDGSGGGNASSSAQGGASPVQKNSTTGFAYADNPPGVDNVMTGPNAQGYGGSGDSITVTASAVTGGHAGSTDHSLPGGDFVSKSAASVQLAAPHL